MTGKKRTSKAVEPTKEPIPEEGSPNKKSKKTQRHIEPVIFSGVGLQEDEADEVIKAIIAFVLNDESREKMAKSRLSGGWEGWLQAELADFLYRYFDREIEVRRELAIFRNMKSSTTVEATNDSKESNGKTTAPTRGGGKLSTIDLWLRQPKIISNRTFGGPYGIELKVEYVTYNPEREKKAQSGVQSKEQPGEPLKNAKDTRRPGDRLPERLGDDICKFFDEKGASTIDDQYAEGEPTIYCVGITRDIKDLEQKSWEGIKVPIKGQTVNFIKPKFPMNRRMAPEFAAGPASIVWWQKKMPGPTDSRKAKPAMAWIERSKI